MRLEGIKPSNFSGPALLLVVLAFMIFILGTLDFLQLKFITGAWVLIFASWGISVELEGKTLILKYAFGLLKIKIKWEDIEEILILNKLDRGIFIKYFPEIGILYAGLLIYALYSFFAFPRDLLLGYYMGSIGVIVFSLAILISWSIPFRKSYYRWAGLLFCFSLGIVLIWLKIRSFESMPLFIVWILLASFATLETDSTDYIVLKTRKGRYLLTSNAPKDKVERALKAIMEALSDD
ncbi:hypothetical protein K1720_00240 [Thermococcus argininiproducens]|uniref:Uncharacterized protein n=1 Tax=Thermococcus argininiproducens TaxID=2866384 RepID=A0A9E7M9L7_9EURY|nr:hypothetical protein [Thermococcus argininiproducens]USG99956.1 hypothetical protein K1720_00240 [Thermococcus argininiproducens]